ncbi:cold shock domain-containing protein [Mesoflavibacter sp. CH_XMU1404-2]|uniref:cold-shock protein n=1 Tax=Mesoflavibacter sp. CH_XMU1404-2 TaxID=3107766 RepID=UPI00300A6205
MQEGTVKFFNNLKGFGFIKSSETGEEIFVHNSGLRDDIKEDDKVQFNTEQGKKGLNAINVEVIF